MIRQKLAAVMFIAIGGVCGCGSLSDDEITVRCDQERAAKLPSCVDDDAYAECVSCYEECGDSCRSKGLCPEQYDCLEN
jgi:hypothetical protein